MSGYRVLHFDLSSSNEANPALDFNAKHMRVISAYYEGAAVSDSFDVKTDLYPYPILAVHSQGETTTYNNIKIPVNYSGGNMSVTLTASDGTQTSSGILSLQLQFMP